MRKLDFVVIGAAKSGTTWLWQYFHNHTECFVPEAKELNYFNREAPDPRTPQNIHYGRPVEWYHGFFPRESRALRLGEISPCYLWSKTAPADISSYHSGIRVIAILRDPVERAFSQYRYRVQRGMIKDRGFRAAIESEPFLLERSCYGRHLEHYFNLFDSQQILLLSFDQLQSDPQGLVQELNRFLSISGQPAAMPLEKVNAGMVPKFPALNLLLGRLDLFSRSSKLLSAARARGQGSAALALLRRLRRQGVAGEHCSLEPALRAELDDYFRVDLKKLATLADDRFVQTCPWLQGIDDRGEHSGVTEDRSS